ncbi:MAG: hypothetical protein Q4D51_08250 [Eubacteriales bacterium]|nr:hypothetical protein [Eubacteriales bacterium]
MWEEEWSAPDEYVHQRILQSQKLASLEFTILMIFMFLSITVIAGGMVAKLSTGVVKESVSGPDLSGFYETEETITKELYGDRKAYADGKTFHKEVDFLDKEATRKTGEITYDKEAFEAYYNSFLEEYDAMVDHEKVRGLLEERKQEYIAAHSSVNGGASVFTAIMKYVALGILAFVTCVAFLWYDGRKLMCILRRDYQVIEGTVLSKFNHASRHTFVKKFAEVRYHSGVVNAVMPGSQAIGIRKGEHVYLVALNVRRLSGSNVYAIYKK